MKITFFAPRSKAYNVNVEGSVEFKEIEDLEVDIFAASGFPKERKEDELIEVNIETSDVMDLNRIGRQFPSVVPTVE